VEGEGVSSMNRRGLEKQSREVGKPKRKVNGKCLHNPRVGFYIFFFHYYFGFSGVCFEQFSSVVNQARPHRNAGSVHSLAPPCPKQKPAPPTCWPFDCRPNANDDRFGPTQLVSLALAGSSNGSIAKVFRDIRRNCFGRCLIWHLLLAKVKWQTSCGMQRPKHFVHSFFYFAGFVSLLTFLCGASAFFPRFLPICQ